MLRSFLRPCTKYSSVVGSDRHFFVTHQPQRNYGQSSMIVSTSSLMMNNHNDNGYNVSVQVQKVASILNTDDNKMLVKNNF